MRTPVLVQKTRPLKSVRMKKWVNLVRGRKKVQKTPPLKPLTMKKWVCYRRPPFSCQKTHPLKPVRNFGGSWLNPGGPKKGVREILGGRKWRKPGKRSKIPPAKTPYDAKSGFINAVRGKKGGFSSFLEFSGGFLGDFRTSGLCP